MILSVYELAKAEAIPAAVKVLGESTSFTAESLPAPDVPFDLDIPPDILEAMQDALYQAARLGVADTAGLLGVNVSEAPQAVLSYAERRAAELLGVRKDGSLDEAITETIRRDVRKLTSQAIDKGWSNEELAKAIESMLGPPRARMTARTELGFAYNDGTAEVMDEAGVEFLDIADGVGCLPRGHQKGAPAPSGFPGVIEDQAEANGQVWTVAQFRANPLGHPHCVRSATVHIGA